ncbi:hypothetical protein BGX21_004112 [Mortierella sp. AD011]|nr:hypothetical protein BGX20_002735 [Mortierella sp. AD010]KAF9400523.1 hypothetical protein BGX21_004112 [Mortierella sp. AD011]
MDQKMTKHGQQNSKMRRSMLLLIPALLLITSAWSADASNSAVEPRALQTSSLLDLEMITSWEPSNLDRFDPHTGSLLSPFMIPRVSGTANNTRVQEFILDYFSKLNAASLAGEVVDNDHDQPIGRRNTMKNKKDRERIESANRLYRRAPGKKGTGWHVEIDRFDDTTPYGTKTFTNLIFTKNPNAENRLVFAAHFDSKYFPPNVDPANQRPIPGKNNGGEDTLPFVAATDSAVPCAILLDLAASLDRALDQDGRTDLDTTLQLVFFDGEEAFGDWTHTDSLYGSRSWYSFFMNKQQQQQQQRHLADLWAKRTVHRSRTATGRNGGSTANNLEGIELFVLLDLLGAEGPQVPSYFGATHWAHRHAMSIEQRLWDARLHGTQVLEKRKEGRDDHEADEDDMDDLGSDEPLKGFLTAGAPYGGIDDDHRPFMEKGVPILHVIPIPFPHVWHKLSDNADVIAPEVAEGWANIFRTFTVEYLHLLKPKDRLRDEL